MLSINEESQRIKKVIDKLKRGWDITKCLTQKSNNPTELAEEIYVDSCGKKGLGETPQCVSARRLTSRPRKAKYISGAVYLLHNFCKVRIFLLIKHFFPTSKYYYCNSLKEDSHE